MPPKNLLRSSVVSRANLSDLIFEWLNREAEKVPEDNGGMLFIQVTVPSNVVHFDFDRFNVPPSGLKTISEIAAQVRGSGLVVVLVGSADRVGTDNYNVQLGLSRAKSIEALLKSQGVPSYQIVIGSRTEIELPTQTEDNVREPENRRVDVWLR